MEKTAQTINIRPNWGWAMEPLIAVLQVGTAEGRREASAELRRLAKTMDTLDDNRRILEYSIRHLRANIDDGVLEDLQLTETDAETVLSGLESIFGGGSP